MTQRPGCAVTTSSRAINLAGSSKAHEPPAQAVGLVNTVRRSLQVTATPSPTLSVDLISSFLACAVASGRGWIVDQRCGIAAPSNRLTNRSPRVLRACASGVRMVVVGTPVAEPKANRSVTPSWVRLASDSRCRMPHHRPWTRPGKPLLTMQDQSFRPNRAAVTRPATTPRHGQPSQPHQPGVVEGDPNGIKTAPAPIAMSPVS